MTRSNIYASLIASILFILLPAIQPAKGDLVPLSTPIIDSLVETDRYCNVRFNFCIDFPKNIFTQKELSNNGDGAVFSSPNKELVMNISGEFNVLNRTIQEQMESLFNILETPAYDIDDHTTIVSADHFISLIDQEDRQVYIRSHKYDDYFVNIIVRINNKEYLEGKNLDDEIQLVVNI